MIRGHTMIQSFGQRFHTISTHTCILLCALELSFVYDERFFITLFVQQLLCNTIKEFNASFLLVIIIVVGNVLAGLLSVTSLKFVPLIWHGFSIFICLFLTLAYLMLHLVWNLRVFVWESKNIDIFIYGSLPAVCSAIVSLSFYAMSSRILAAVLTLQGFVTLWICSCYSPMKKFKEQWLFWLDACNLIFLRILPLLTIFMERFETYRNEDFSVFLLILAFAFSGTSFLSELLPIRAPLSAFGRLPSPVAVMVSVTSGILILLNNPIVAELIQYRFDSMVWLIVQTILFIGFLFSLVVSSRANRSKWHCMVTNLLLSVLLIISYVVSLEFSFGIIRDFAFKRLFSKTSWSLNFCALCFISGLITYSLEQQYLFRISVILGLCAFHYVEWQLYEAMIISPMHIIVSSLCLGFCALIILFIWTNGIESHFNTASVSRTRGSLEDSYLAHVNRLCGSITNLSWWSVTCVSILVPTLTKVTLVGWNYWLWSATDTDHLALFGEQAVGRIRFERSTIFGLFLLYLGLLMGFWLFRLDRNYSCGCKFLIGCSFTVALFVMYFSLSIYCIWSPLFRSILGSVPNNFVLILPLAILLAGVFILGQGKEDHISEEDWNQLRSHTAIFMNGSLGFLWFIVISGRILDCSLTVLLTYVLAVSGIVLLLRLLTRVVPRHDAWSGVKLHFPVHSWLSLSMRLGMWIGFIVLTLVLWLNAAQLSDVFILSMMGFSFCLSGLMVLPYMSYTNLFEERRSSQRDGVVVAAPLLDSLPEWEEPDQPREEMDIVQPVVRLKLILLGLGSALLYLTWIVHEPSDFDNSGQLLLLVLTVALFVLSQMAVGCPRIIFPLRDRPFEFSSSHSLVLTCAVNVMVILAIVLLCFTFPWTYSNVEILFLPCLLFGLTGKWAGGHQLFAPLLVLTLVLLSSVWQQFQFFSVSEPPLPTFNRPAVYASSSKWRAGIEAVLTILMIPVHALFLFDQADWSTEQFLSLVLPRCLLPDRPRTPKNSTCSNRTRWKDIAHLLSEFCAFILLAVHVLALTCIAYVFVAGSFASALYGLYSFAVCIYLLLKVNVITIV